MSGQLAEIIETLNQALGNSSTIFSATAALASLIAATASLWAASSAYRATNNVKKLARLELLRKLNQAAYDVISEAEQAKSVLEQLKVEIQTLSVFSGHGARSPMMEKITSDAQAKYDKLVPLKEEAEKLIGSCAKLERKSEDDLSQQLSAFDGYLSQVRRLHAQLEKETESYAAQNRMHQANVINRTR